MALWILRVIFVLVSAGAGFAVINSGAAQGWSGSSAIGVFLGVIAVQTRSIIPCILFHGVHNGLAVMLSLAKASVVETSPILSQILVTQDGVHYQYGIVPGIVMGMLGLSLMVWFLRLPAARTTKLNMQDTCSDMTSPNPAGVT